MRCEARTYSNHWSGLYQPSEIALDSAACIHRPDQAVWVTYRVLFDPKAAG